MKSQMSVPFTPYFRWAFLIAIALSGLLLSGCNSMRIVESQVQTNVQWSTGSTAPAAVPAKAHFRLDRLPADVNNLQAGWAELELEAALAPLGWTRNDVEAQYTIWIGVRAAEFIADPWGQRIRSPWVNHFSVRIGTPYRPRSAGWGMGIYPSTRAGFPPPSGYAQEVSIIIRDLKTSNVVYQTKASHEGPWADHPSIWRAMIAAALQGFPQPTAANRRVDISIPQ
jgi:outer membrane murein-binding lipoprotein Lpp